MVRYDNPYEPALRLHMATIGNHLANNGGVGDLEKTESLCRYMMKSVLSIVDSILQLMSERKLTESRILTRSQLEYTTDMLLLAIENDTNLNRKFIGYHKLIKYWQSGQFSRNVSKESIATFAAEYMEHVRNVLLEDFEDPLCCQNIVKIEHLTPMERRTRLQQALPELSLADLSDEYLVRINSISMRKCAITGSMDYWREIDKRIKRRYSKHWSGLPFANRIDKIKRHFGPDSVHTKTLTRSWIFYSGFVHPTVYSVIPHFDPKSEGFEGDWDVSDRSLAHVQKTVFYLVQLAHEAYCMCLAPEKARAMKVEFGRVVIASGIEAMLDE